MNRLFVTVGLGRLGTSMVNTLDSLGLTVLALKPKDGPGSLRDGDVLVVEGFRQALDRHPHSSSQTVRRRFPACAR